MQKSLATRIATVAVVAYTVAILVGSLGPMPEMPPETEGIPPDKKLHFAAYLVMSVAWMLYLHLIVFKKRRFLTTIAITFIGAFIYGLVIEVLQATLTASRSGDLLDLLANSVGIVSGIILIALIRYQSPALK